MIVMDQITISPMTLEFYEALIAVDMAYFRKKDIRIPKSWFSKAYTEIVSSFISMISLGCHPNFLGWMIQDRSTGDIVGDFNFNGAPDNGEVEISYSILEAYQNKGYGSQLIKGILIWSYFQNDIRFINAQTKANNIKSKTVLKKNGFEVVNEHQVYVDFKFDMTKLPKQFSEFKFENGCAISSCLLGLNSKYNGSNNEDLNLLIMSKQTKMVPFCPEQMGGLSTPRIPAEIVGDRVMTKTGNDVTSAFYNGAIESVKVLKVNDQRIVILKDGSPSCGSTKIYDGSFSMQKINGMGMTCKKLLETFDNLLIYNENRDLLIWQGGHVEFDNGY